MMKLEVFRKDRDLRVNFYQPTVFPSPSPLRGQPGRERLESFPAIFLFSLFCDRAKDFVVHAYYNESVEVRSSTKLRWLGEPLAFRSGTLSHLCSFCCQARS